MEKSVFMNENQVGLEGCSVNGYFKWVGKRNGAKGFLIIRIFLERKKIEDFEYELRLFFATNARSFSLIRAFVAIKMVSNTPLSY